jgi:hypothetical protein
MRWFQSQLRLHRRLSDIRHAIMAQQAGVPPAEGREANTVHAVGCHLCSLAFAVLTAKAVGDENIGMPEGDDVKSFELNTGENPSSVVYRLP